MNFPFWPGAENKDNLMTEAYQVNFFFLGMDRIGSSSQYVLFKFIYFLLFCVGIFVCFFVCIPSPSSLPPVFLSLRQGFSVKYYPETCFTDPGLELKRSAYLCFPSAGIKHAHHHTQYCLTVCNVCVCLCVAQIKGGTGIMYACPCEADAESLTLFIGKRALTEPRTRQFKLV